MLKIDCHLITPCELGLLFAGKLHKVYFGMMSLLCICEADSYFRVLSESPRCPATVWPDESLLSVRRYGRRTERAERPATEMKRSVIEVQRVAERPATEMSSEQGRTTERGNSAQVHVR